MIMLLAQIALAVPAMLGLLVIYHIVRKQEKPADTSNRIGKARLVWFALTKEGDFVGMYPWLANDEGDNV